MTINQTTPASTPMDTLKAIVHRNIDLIEHISDYIGGSEIPSEYALELLDALKQQQFDALGEHMVIGVDDQFGVLPKLPDEAYVYDDGSSIRGVFKSVGVSSVHYVRYDGTHEEGLARHEEAVRQLRHPALQSVSSWGSHDPLNS